VQYPQALCSHAIPTWSPSFNCVTPGPSATTVPAPSCPGIKGRVGFTGQSPYAACRSVWHTPLATISTKACPGPGMGTGTSRTTKGCPNFSTTAACIIRGIVMLYPLSKLLRLYPSDKHTTVIQITYRSDGERTWGHRVSWGLPL